MNNQNAIPAGPPRASGPHEGMLRSAIERLTMAGIKTDELLTELHERTSQIRVQSDAPAKDSGKDVLQNSSIGYNIHEQAEATELRNEKLRRLIDELAI